MNAKNKKPSAEKMATSSKVIILLAVISVVVAIMVGRWISQPVGSSGQAVAVTEPTLPPRAAAGKVAFSNNCAVCHGATAGGTNAGPPLIHKIYEPNHHGDQAFIAAMQRGVRAHHWSFGNMPPIENVAEEEALAIIFYIRTLQRANGIF